MSQGGDTPDTPCADTEEDASAATEASKGCAGYRCEERVNASSVESLASVVVSAGRKRRVPRGITTNQQVRASQVGKKLGSVYLKPRQVQRVSRLSNRTFSQKTFVRVKVVRRLLAVRPKYSRDVPDLKEHRRQSVEGCLRAGNNSKARRDKAPSKNGRRQVVDRGSPAPAKQRTRSVSQTVAAKKSALSRTCSVSNKKASKNHVITSTGIIGPEVQFHSLGASWDETPFGGPVGLVALVQPSAAAKGGGRLLHNCDSTDPQGIMTTSATVPGSSEIACTVTEDPPSRGTVERVSVKVEPKPVAMETAVFKDPVVESGGVRSNCAVYVGPRFDTGNWDSHANICVLSSTYREGVHTDEIGACRRDVFIDLTENDCPSTSGSPISSPSSVGYGRDLDGATCSLPTPIECTSHFGAGELSAAVNKQANATSASIGRRDFAQPEAPKSSANAATISEFHCSEEGTTTSTHIREEADTANAVARPHELELALVSSPQKGCQSSLMSSDDGSSIAAADKCASSQGCSENGDAILGAERASPEQRERGGDVRGASGIIPAQHRWPAGLRLLVAPEEYSSRMCPADENIAPV